MRVVRQLHAVFGRDRRHPLEEVVQTLPVLVLRHAPGHARPNLTLLLEIGDCRSAARWNREADAGRAVGGLTVGGEKAVP